MPNNDIKRYHQQHRANRLTNLVHEVVGELAAAQAEKGYGTYKTLRVSNLSDAILSLEYRLGDEVGDDLWASLMSRSKLNPSVGPLNPSAETRKLVVDGLLYDLRNLKDGD